VRGRKTVVSLHRTKHAFIESHATGDVLSDYGFKTDRSEFAFAGERAGVFELREAILNRLRIISHALEAAFVQKALGPVREVEQAPLERGRADIGDENFHSRIGSYQPVLP